MKKKFGVYKIIGKDLILKADGFKFEEDAEEYINQLSEVEFFNNFQLSRQTDAKGRYTILPYFDIK